jgi:Restriction endonuclease
MELRAAMSFSPRSTVPSYEPHALLRDCSTRGLSVRTGVGSDGDAAMTRWEQFERLAEKIMQDLAPHAEVKWNDRIIGQDSETDRQIDVSVKWKDGEKRYLLIIDAKDWRDPANISNIEKFAGMVRDVRASKGILVCNAGFSKQAHTYARNLGIGLCNLHDAESRDWSRDLSTPGMGDRLGVKVPWRKRWC